MMAHIDLDTIAGADASRIGKRKGWAVVELRIDQQVEVHFKESLVGYFGESNPSILGVDIPIGLPRKGKRRQADVEAKALLGPRASTVFHTPPRQVLVQLTHADACEVEPVSAQSYALRSKIFEVDLLSRKNGERVVEVHPEVSFWALAGRPLPPKKSWNGLRERLAILKRQGIEFKDCFPDDAGLIPPDDILDAAVVALTARDVLNGTGRALPEGLEVEKRSQRELIWMPKPVCWASWAKT